MSVRINFQETPEHSIADILLLAATTLSNHKEALAVDGLRVIFQTLKESSERLENKLLYMHDLTKRIRQSEMEKAVSISSILSEVWIIIDNIRRVDLFTEHIPHIDYSSTGGAEFKKSMNEVKGIRDSLHHINERIAEYYIHTGGSILGDIIYRYKLSTDEPEMLNAIITGVNKISENINGGQIQDERFLSNTGIYDLHLRYVKKEKKRQDNKWIWEAKSTTINIDYLVSVINSLIIYLDEYYSAYWHSELAGNPDLKLKLPSTIGIRIKQEAWNASKRERDKLAG